MEYFALLWVICCGASVYASVWLLRLINRSPSYIACKLLPRQLWHLALADILAFSLLHLGSLYGVVAPWLEWDNQLAFRAICVPNLWYRIGIITSALFEAHIAMAMMANRLRRHKLMRILNRSLGATWMIGIFLGFVSISITYMWDQPRMSSSYHCVENHMGSHVKNAVLMSSVVFVLGVYLYVSTFSHQVSGMHQRHLLNQIGYLLLANVVSTGPRVFLQAFGVYRVWFPGHVTNWVVEPLYALGGFSNWVVYCALNQRTRRMLRSTGAPRRRSKSKESALPKGSSNVEVASFSVGFAEAEVIPVASVYEDAERVTDQETRILEKQKSQEEALRIKLQQEDELRRTNNDEVQRKIGESNEADWEDQAMAELFGTFDDFSRESSAEA